MAEPTTAITDFLMAGVAFVLAAKLISYWRFAFFFTAVAALAGGIYHSTPSMIVWKVTVYSVGLATLFLILAASRATFAFRVFSIFAIAEFVVYGAWMATHNDFIYVIADYGSGMLGVAALYITAFPRMTRASRLVLASIAVAALGAVVQATRFTLHPRFNFNDLYHVIQIVSLILLYRGARASEPARTQPNRRSYSFLTIR